MTFTSAILLFILKCVVCIHDIITFPVYFILQQPWKKWKYDRKKWGQLLQEDDPSSPCIRIVRSVHNDMKAFQNLKTMDEYFRKSVECYRYRTCTGEREVLYEVEEFHKNGKKLKKVFLGDEYKWFSFNDIDVRIENLSKGMREIGIFPKQQVMIFAETRIEWMLTCQACFRLNVPVVTMYATLDEEGILHGINETQVTHVFTSQDLIGKLKKISNKIVSITHIIYMENTRRVDSSEFPENVQTLSFSNLEKIGATGNQNSKPDPPTADDIAVIMYTSGSTGIPKGVKLTHKNMVTALSGFLVCIPPIHPTEVGIGYLPLAHAIEILTECFFFTMGVRFGYSSPLTLTEKSSGIVQGCKGDLELLKPSVLMTVPMVLDRIMKGLNEAMKQKGDFARDFFKFAMAYKFFWYKKGFNTPILNRLVFQKIKDAVGGKLRLALTGGAPVSPDTQNFARMCLDCQILQAYGTTETCANATCMDVNDFTAGRIGPPTSNSFLRMVGWPEGNYYPTDKPYPRGELLVGGDNISTGYFKRDDLTEESFKVENGVRWFYTGDIVELHPDGAFKIIDRKKDIVKLQHGEYISLGRVEMELRTCALVDNICVVGNSFHNNLVALVCPNVEQLKSLAKSLNKEGLNIQEMCQDPTIVSEVLKQITKHGQKSTLLRVEIPTKIKLCSEEWLPDTGFVSAALKIRRKPIEQYYQTDIEEMYGIHKNGQSKFL